MCLIRIHRYASDNSVRTRGSQYAVDAKKALKDDLENITLEAIQTCIIVGNHCMAECDPAAESLYFGKPFLPSLSGKNSAHNASCSIGKPYGTDPTYLDYTRSR